MLFVAFPLYAANGVFMVVKGDIKIEAPGKGVTRARVGMKVFEGNKIVAGKDSRAKIVMSDKNVLNISPDSQIIIEKYEYDASKNNKNVTLNVLYGKVRSTVNQKYDGDKNKFQVKTPTAVAGVRGTDFLSQYNRETKAAQFVTFEGQVQVGQIDMNGSITNAVTVNAGQLTTATNGAPPSAPAPVPQNMMQKMDQESNAETQPTPAQEAKAEPKKNETKKEEAKAKQEQKGEPTKEASKDSKNGNTKKTAAPGPKAPNTKSSNGEVSKNTNNDTDTRNTASTGPGPTSPPPPSMLEKPTSELPQQPVQPILGPIVTAPPPIPEVYKPPELAPDIIQQQRTLLKINIVAQ